MRPQSVLPQYLQYLKKLKDSSTASRVTLKNVGRKGTKTVKISTIDQIKTSYKNAGSFDEIAKASRSADADTARAARELLGEILQGKTKFAKRFAENVGDADKLIRKILEESVTKKGGMLGNSQGGTIPGKGPQNVDSVPAMLAPGEEVIRASAANMFRPVLKDINSNAGRLFGEFRSGVEQQKTDLSLQRDTTQKSIGILSDFKEFVESFANELKLEQLKKKRKELEGLLGTLGICLLYTSDAADE